MASWLYIPADIPAGIIGGRGEVRAFLTEADIPALLRKGALEALGGKEESPRNAPTLGRLGAEAPVTVGGKSHYVLNAASFLRGRDLLGSCPTRSAARFGLVASTKRPVLSNGGLRCLKAEAGLHQFDPPPTFSERTEVSSGDSVGSFLPDP